MITREQIRRLENFSYLWDREGAWAIDKNHMPVYRLTIKFSGPDGPNITDLARMRQLLPELAELTPQQAKVHIGTGSMYILGEFIGQAGRYLLEEGRAMGLTVLKQYYLQVSYELKHLGGIPAPIVDGDEEWEYILEKMRDAGCPVSINDVD